MNKALHKIHGRVRFVLPNIAFFGVLLYSPLQAQKKITGEKPTATKILEIGRVSNKDFIRKIEEVGKTYDPSTALYIMNYGSDKEIARREKMIGQPLDRLLHYRGRFTLVRGGLGRKGPATVIWKVPEGASSPEP